jgi:hypothetical protein
MKTGIIALFTILLFCNFGRVEYSALNPKAKTIQVDSASKIVVANPPQTMSNDVSKPEQEASETSDDQQGIIKYVALGIKLFFNTLLKLLIA